MTSRVNRHPISASNALSGRPGPGRTERTFSGVISSPASTSTATERVVEVRVSGLARLALEIDLTHGLPGDAGISAQLGELCRFQRKAVIGPAPRAINWVRIKKERHSLKSEAPTAITCLRS